MSNTNTFNQELYVIYNPISNDGHLKKTNFKQEVLKMCPNSIFYETQFVGHAQQLAKQLSSKKNKKTIVVVGGDGTMHEILNGIEDFEKIDIILLPYGSGNDFARGFDFPLEMQPIDLLKQILQSWKCKKVDFLLLNDKVRIMNSFTMGITAEILKYRNKMKHFSPKNRYKIASLVKGLFFKNFKMKIRPDNQAWIDVNGPFICCQNSRYVGGGIVSVPCAKADDGLLSYSILSKFCHLKVIYCLRKLIKGQANKIKQFKEAFAKKLEFIFPWNNFNVELDGIIYELPKESNVRVVPSKLSFFVPYLNKKSA